MPTDTFGNTALRGSPVPAAPVVPEQTAAQRNNAIQASGQLPVPAVAQKPSVEPTTLYSGNIQEKVIPDLNSRLAALGPRQTYTDLGGFLRYSDDRGLVEAPVDATPNEQGSWESGGNVYGTGPAFSGDEKQDALIGAMMKNLDANTRQVISSITQNANVLRQKQERINAAAEAGTEQALLLGGSSRYAPLSSGGTMQVQQSYGLEQIAGIDAREQAAIAKARQAQQDGNFKLMGEALSTAESMRKEKQEVAQKLAEKQSEELKKLREREIQSSRDNAVAGLVAQGITDPTRIMDLLTEAANAIGEEGDFTAKEIADTLKNIMPAGLDDLLKTLRQNGAPPDVISKVMKSSDMGAAYSAAGNYAAGGTGTIGEYNYAKAQGYTGSFSDYQNEDANRKQRAAGGGDRTLSVTEAIALGVPFGTLASQAYGFTPHKPPTEGNLNASIYAERMQQADEVLKDLTSDITGMRGYDFATQVALEPNTLGSVLVSDTVRQQRQAERNFVNAVLRRESGAVISDSEFANAAKQYFPRPGDDKKTLEQKAAARSTALVGIAKAAGPAWDGTNTGASLADKDKSAITKIATFRNSSSENARKVEELAKIAPNATAEEIAKQLGL